jgi:hypothetical protein
VFYERSDKPCGAHQSPHRSEATDLYEWLVVCRCLLPVLPLRVEVVHGLAQQVGFVGVCQAGAGVLDLLGVVAVQLLHDATRCILSDLLRAATGSHYDISSTVRWAEPHLASFTCNGCPTAAITLGVPSLTH